MAGYTKNKIEHFKEQLKLLMKSHNLTARKLSEEIGYSITTISSLLTGETKVHEYHIQLICEYFQIGENSLTRKKIERGKNGEFNFKQSEKMVY